MTSPTAHFFSARIALVITLVSLAACSKSPDVENKPTEVAAASQSGSSLANAPSKLGDLSAFRAIAADVAMIVENGNLAEAKTRIKALEIAWDAAESGLKPRSSDDWHGVDKAIDRALDALRSRQPNATNCKQTIAELLKKIDQVSGKN